MAKTVRGWLVVHLKTAFLLFSIANLETSKKVLAQRMKEVLIIKRQAWFLLWLY